MPGVLYITSFNVLPGTLKLISTYMYSGGGGGGNLKLVEVTWNWPFSSFSLPGGLPPVSWNKFQPTPGMLKLGVRWNGYTGIAVKYREDVSPCRGANVWQNFQSHLGLAASYQTQDVDPMLG